jgi:hypothetical protein
MKAPTLGHHVLPNLLSVRWNDDYTWTLTPFLRLFLNPGLVNVRIEFPTTDPHPYHLAVVSSIPTRHLAHLRLYSLPSGNDDSFLEALQNLLEEASGTLISVCLYGEISARIFDSLLRFHNLRYLKVESPMAPISPPDIVLPSLEKLVVRSESVSLWLPILAKIPDPALQSLKVTFLEDSSPTDFQMLGSSLQNTNKGRTLTSLKCCWEDMTTITEAGLRPLLSFERLTTLILSSVYTCIVQLDDSFICRLAMALPRLETLMLGDSLCDAVDTRNVTIEGLVALATNCVDLNFLQLPFDATDIPSRDTHANSQTRKSSCKLRTLSVGENSLLPSGHDDVSLVAFVLLRIFPHVEKIIGAEREWREVKRVVKLLRKASTIILPFT